MSTTPTSGSHRIVVLNVDDYEAGRYATTRILRQAGYDVVEAGTGEEALRRAQDHPDLIVLDVNLPDVDGFEVCRRIKATPDTSAIPVLYLSAAYRAPEHRVQGLELGADGYLTQPVDGRELVATVNALLRARHVRDAVAESEARFRSLMTATSDVIWTTDSNGAIRTEQPEWGEFTGQGRDEYLGWGWVEALHPDDRERTRGVWERVVHEASLYEIDYRLRRADGEYRLMRVRGVPVYDEDGGVREWVGACTDITEQQLAEEFLARHAQQLRDLAVASLAISSALSLEATLRAIAEHARVIIGAHQAVATLEVGADEEETLSVAFFSERDAAFAGRPVRLAPEGIHTLVARSGRPVRLTQLELEAHPAGGGTTRLAPGLPPARGWLAAPLVARDGQSLGLIQLTDKVEGEFSEPDEAMLVQLAQIGSVAIENTRLLEETREANRAKSDFLATMSHELRTPLNAMVGYTDLLTLGVPVAIPEGAREHVERIRGAALHLTQLIEEVLTHARLEAGRDELHLETVHLPHLLDEAAGMMEPLARQKGLRFILDVGAAPHVVETDPRKLRQILLNLLGNAVKFTERGEVTLHARAENDHLVVEVRDTGIGIPTAFLEKIFEPFWQVDGTKTRRAGGTGLGLGVVRQLAERLGGDVSVTSTEGAGSVFTVRVPVEKPGTRD